MTVRIKGSLPTSQSHLMAFPCNVPMITPSHLKDLGPHFPADRWRGCRSNGAYILFPLNILALYSLSSSIISPLHSKSDSLCVSYKQNAYYSRHVSAQMYMSHA